jgi:hypothetical protein
MGERDGCPVHVRREIWQEGLFVRECAFLNEVRFFKLKSYSIPKETKPFSHYTFADRQYTGFRIQFFKNLYKKVVEYWLMKFSFRSMN